MRVVRALVILAVGLWLVVEIAAIPLTNQVVQSEVAARDRNAATVKASVGTFPLLTRLLLTGKVPHVHVTLDQVSGERLAFAEVRFDVDGVSIDRSALLQRKFRVEHIDSGKVTGTINLSDISPLAGRIASRATVNGHTLFLGPLRFGLSSTLFPCSPDAIVEGDHITLSCTFTEIPDVVFDVKR
jgi:hypothetical protein